MILLFSLLGLVMVLFIFLPLATMIVSSDPGAILSAFLDPEVQQSIWLTITAGLWATIIAAVFGIPLSYVLARRSFWGKGFVEGMIDLPIIIPHSAAGIALLTVFGRKFYGGKFFDLFGIRFIGEIPGIVVAMIFVSVPFLIHSARDGFIAVDPRMERVAQTLGASPWQVFWKVSLPLASRNILSGAVMMWARGSASSAR
jgi:molybdate/tungstate transport system permease protein